MYIFECLHLICLMIERKNNLFNRCVLLVQTPAYLEYFSVWWLLNFFYGMDIFEIIIKSLVWPNWWYKQRFFFFHSSYSLWLLFFPTVILLLMLHSTTCSLVWTEAASPSEVWSVVFISYAVTRFLEVLHRPIWSVVKKQNFLRAEKWDFNISTWKPCHSFGNCACGIYCDE